MIFGPNKSKFRRWFRGILALICGIAIGSLGNLWIIVGLTSLYIAILVGLHVIDQRASSRKIQVVTEEYENILRFEEDSDTKLGNN